MAPRYPAPIGGSWYCDGWDDNLKIFHRVRETVFSGASQYQQIEVLATHDLGRLLVIDGLPQAAECDEMVYAKAFSWPAVLGVAGPKRVLITGGGDGHVLREVLRFPSVTSAVICDIDAMVSDVTRAHMPFMWGGADRDPRVTIIHADAQAYLEAAPPSSFEVVISDITDPTGEASASHHLYSTKYFQSIRRVLAPGGICAAQAQELSVKDWQHHKRLRDTVATVFPAVRSGSVYVPSFGYPEGFVFACDDEAPLHLDARQISRRLDEARLGGDTHFDAVVYHAMFALPPMVRSGLGI
jgi:spermidine synthase